MPSYQQMIQTMQKMQREYQREQSKLDETEFTNTANGVVTVTMKGDLTILSLEFLDKEILNKDDAEMVSEMVILAYNGCKDKIDKANEALASKYQQSMGGGMF